MSRQEPSRQENRRQFLKRTGAGLASVWTASSLWNGATPSLFANEGGSQTPGIEILENGFVCNQENVFYGWPTIAKTKEGELLVVASEREDHVDPFGRVALFRSRDNGKSWSWPQTIYDGPLDDRDAGILVTSKGTLLVTTFTESGYYALLAAHMDRVKNNIEPKPGDWDIAGERFDRWMSAHNRLTDEQRKKEDRGSWMLRSTDDGVTWGARFECVVSSPHGPFETSDHRILFPGRDHSDHPRVHVMESRNDGKTWRHLSDIPVRPGDDKANYHELHGVEAADGTLIVQIRNHNVENCNETLQTESYDGGRSWTYPHSIGVWGFPSHLIKLQDNRLLMSYGHRRDPVSELARVSEDNGRTWSEPLTIWHIDDMGHDFGYPATVQLDDGSLLTVWYEVIKGTWFAAIRQTHWRLV